MLILFLYLDLKTFVLQLPAVVLCHIVWFMNQYVRWLRRQSMLLINFHFNWSMLAMFKKLNLKLNPQSKILSCGNRVKTSYRPTLCFSNSSKSKCIRGSNEHTNVNEISLSCLAILLLTTVFCIPYFSNVFIF